jgi:hypothetical protein
MAKSPYDVAMLLDYLVSPETRDTRESYTTAVTESWEGIGIAMLDPEKWKFPAQFIRPVEEATLQIVQLSPIHLYSADISARTEKSLLLTRNREEL